MIFQDIAAPKQGRTGPTQFTNSLHYIRGVDGERHEYENSLAYSTEKDGPQPVHQKLRGERILYEMTHGIASIDTADFEMQAVASRSRMKDPVAHIVQSFDSSRGEMPSVAKIMSMTEVEKQVVFEEIRAMAERNLRARGFTDGKGRYATGKDKAKGVKISKEDRKRMREAGQSGELNQYVLVVHGDKDHLHVHVLVNKVAQNGVTNDDRGNFRHNEHVAADIAIERGWEPIIGNHNLNKCLGYYKTKGATEDELEGLKNRDAKTLDRLRELRSGVEPKNRKTAAEMHRQRRNIEFRSDKEIGIRNVFENITFNKPDDFKTNLEISRHVLKTYNVDLRIKPKGKEGRFYGATFINSRDHSVGFAGSDIGLSAKNIFKIIGEPTPEDKNMLHQEAALEQGRGLRAGQDRPAEKKPTKQDLKEQSADFISTMYALARDPVEFDTLLLEAGIRSKFHTEVGKKDGKLYPRLVFSIADGSVAIGGAEIGISGSIYHKRWPDAEAQLKAKREASKHDDARGEDVGSSLSSYVYQMGKARIGLTSSFDEYVEAMKQDGDRPDTEKVGVDVILKRHGNDRIGLSFGSPEADLEILDYIDDIVVERAFLEKRWPDFADKSGEFLDPPQVKQAEKYEPVLAPARSEESIALELAAAEPEAPEVELPPRQDYAPPASSGGSILDSLGEGNSAFAQGFRAGTQIMEAIEKAVTPTKPEVVRPEPKPRPDPEKVKPKAAEKSNRYQALPNAKFDPKVKAVFDEAIANKRPQALLNEVKTAGKPFEDFCRQARAEGMLVKLWEAKDTEGATHYKLSFADLNDKAGLPGQRAGVTADQLLKVFPDAYSTLTKEQTDRQNAAHEKRQGRKPNVAKQRGEHDVEVARDVGGSTDRYQAVPNATFDPKARAVFQQAVKNGRPQALLDEGGSFEDLCRRARTEGMLLKLSEAKNAAGEKYYKLSFSDLNNENDLSGRDVGVSANQLLKQFPDAYPTAKRYVRGSTIEIVENADGTLQPINTRTDLNKLDRDIKRVQNDSSLTVAEKKQLLGIGATEREARPALPEMGLSPTELRLGSRYYTTVAEGYELGAREIARQNGLWRGLHDDVDFSGAGGLGRWLRDIRSKRQQKLREEQQDRSDNNQRISTLDRAMDRIGLDRATYERDRNQATSGRERERAEMKIKHLEIDAAYVVEKDTFDQAQIARIKRETKAARRWHNFKRDFSVWKVGAVAAIGRDFKLRSKHDLKDRVGKSPAELRWMAEENKKIQRYNAAVREQHRIDVAARKEAVRADYSERWQYKIAGIRASRDQFADKDAWTRNVITDAGYDPELRALARERLAVQQIDEWNRATSYKPAVLYFDERTQGQVERHMAGEPTPVNEMAKLIIEVSQAADVERRAEAALPGKIVLDPDRVEALIKARIEAGVFEPLTNAMKTADAENRYQARVAYEVEKARSEDAKIQKAQAEAQTKASEAEAASKKQALTDVDAWFDRHVKIRKDLSNQDKTSVEYLMAQANQHQDFGRDDLGRISVVDREGRLQIVASVVDREEAIAVQTGFNTDGKESHVARLMAAVHPNLKDTHDDGRPYLPLVVDRDQLKALVEAGRHDIPDLLKAATPEIAANIKGDIDLDRARKDELARQAGLAAEAAKARQARIDGDVEDVASYLGGQKLSIATDFSTRQEAQWIRAGRADPNGDRFTNQARLLALVGPDHIADRGENGRHHIVYEIDQAWIEAKIRGGATGIPSLIADSRPQHQMLVKGAEAETAAREQEWRDNQADDLRRSRAAERAFNADHPEQRRPNIMDEIARQDAEAERAKAEIKPGVRPQIEPIATPQFANLQVSKHEIMRAEAVKPAEAKTPQSEPIRVQPVAEAKPDLAPAAKTPAAPQPEPKQGLFGRIAGAFGKTPAPEKPVPEPKPVQAIRLKPAVQPAPVQPRGAAQPVAEPKSSPAPIPAQPVVEAKPVQVQAPAMPLSVETDTIFDREEAWSLNTSPTVEELNLRGKDFLADGRPQISRAQEKIYDPNSTTHGVALDYPLYGDAMGYVGKMERREATPAQIVAEAKDIRDAAARIVAVSRHLKLGHVDPEPNFNGQFGRLNLNRKAVSAAIKNGSFKDRHFAELFRRSLNATAFLQREQQRAFKREQDLAKQRKQGQKPKGHGIR